MSLAFVMLANAAVLLLLTTLLWIISVRLRDVSIVDLFWGTGFGVVGWVSYWNAQLGTTRGLVLAVIATVWGVRLSVYLGLRNHGRPEDYRYAAMRAKRDTKTWYSRKISSTNDREQRRPEEREERKRKSTPRKPKKERRTNRKVGAEEEVEVEVCFKAPPWCKCRTAACFAFGRDPNV